MSFRSLRWHVAALAAFLMGVPLAEKAMADNTSDIFGSASSLAGAIIDAVGNS